MPHHLIVNIEFGMQLALNLTLESRVSIRRHRSFACLINIIYLHIHGHLPAQLNAAITMVEVELDQASRCKHSPPQASEAGPLYCSA
jgi:hypothetical protein